MPNNFFQFKQFIIHQQHCAMKVCTDACLFGAWTAHLIIDKKIQSAYILDIGAGTGLLSLMLAQQLRNCIIDAIEIQIAAAKQATANFAASPWQERLHVFNTSIQSFTSSHRYDFIISNPPFFQNDLQSKNEQRNVALHSHRLSLEELITAIQLYLSPAGHFAVLLPQHRATTFELLAQQAGFCTVVKISVQQTPKHEPFRSMLLFGRSQEDVVQTTIIIKENRGNYTDAFVGLLKDYYQYL